MHGSKVRNISTRSALEAMNYDFDCKYISSKPWAEPLKTLGLALWLRRNYASYGAIICQTPFIVLLLKLSTSKIPLIIELGECQTLHLSRLPRTLQNRIRYAIWYLIEATAASCASFFVAISDQEAREWVRLFPRLNKKVRVVNHSIAWTAKPPASTKEEVLAKTNSPIDDKIVCFVGAISGKQNLAAVKWIVENLAPNLPESVSILLCGEGSEQFQREGGAGAKVKGLGFVADVDSVIGASDLCIAPLASGAGVKTKVLHYFAHGKQVVGTKLAFEGLTLTSGMIECDLNNFAHKVQEVLETVEDPACTQDRLAKQSEWLDQFYGKEQVARQWNAVIVDALSVVP